MWKKKKTPEELLHCVCETHAHNISNIHCRQQSLQTQVSEEWETEHTWEKSKWDAVIHNRSKCLQKMLFTTHWDFSGRLFYGVFQYVLKTTHPIWLDMKVGRRYCLRQIKTGSVMPALTKKCLISVLEEEMQRKATCLVRVACMSFRLDRRQPMYFNALPSLTHIFIARKSKLPLFVSLKLGVHF